MEGDLSQCPDLRKVFDERPQFGNSMNQSRAAFVYELSNDQSQATIVLVWTYVDVTTSFYEYTSLLYH